MHWGSYGCTNESDACMWRVYARKYGHKSDAGITVCMSQPEASPYFSTNFLVRVGELFARGVDSKNFSERYRNLRSFSLVLLNKASVQCGSAMAEAGVQIGGCFACLWFKSR